MISYKGAYDENISRKRSHIMRSIHSKNTKPEIIVEGILSNLDINYMAHCHSLYGKPDFCAKYIKPQYL